MNVMQKISKETWYTYKLFATVSGYEHEGPRLLTPYSNPQEFESPFNLVWSSVEKAQSGMLAWIAGAVDSISTFTHDVIEELAEAEVETAGWLGDLSAEARVELEAELGKLVLVELTLGPAGSSASTDIWSEDDTFQRVDWRYDVGECNTNLGYWDWVDSKREASKD